MYVLYIFWHIGIVFYVVVTQVGSSQVASSGYISPTWNFQCVRELENARLEKIVRLGVEGAAVDDLLLVLEGAAVQHKAYLATLSGDSE